MAYFQGAGGERPTMSPPGSAADVNILKKVKWNTSQQQAGAGRMIGLKEGQ